MASGRMRRQCVNISRQIFFFQSSEGLVLQLPWKPCSAPFLLPFLKCVYLEVNPMGCNGGLFPGKYTHATILVCTGSDLFYLLDQNRKAGSSNTIQYILN